MDFSHEEFVLNHEYAAFSVKIPIIRVNGKLQRQAKMLSITFERNLLKLYLIPIQNLVWNLMMKV